MDNEQNVNSVSSGTTSTEPAISATNYSRWMTDSFADIKHMKLWQLAIPSAHNSGSDKGAVDFIGEKWVACQDDRFLAQMKAGVRVLDLRLYDDSYGKMVGNLNPKYEFVERFVFKHGGWGKRLLAHLISDVKIFAEENPREFIVLDFHVFDKGKSYSYNSLERCLKYFAPIKSRMLPVIASDKTLEEIYQDHPGANIIFSFSYGRTPDWEPDKPEDTYDPKESDLMWPAISHRWNFKDSSEEGIAEMVAEAMRSPPTSAPWALSATVFDGGITGGGPKNLSRDSPVRTIPFADGGRKICILMADFVERAEARDSVIDKCIELNLQIARDKTPPTAPTGFIVRQLRLTDEGAKEEYYQNTTLFSWNHSFDALGVRRYLIFQNNQLAFVSSDNHHLVKDLNKLNSTFKVCAVDISGNVSDFSNEVELIQDTVPPTMPTELKFTRYGFPAVRIEWVESSDGNGSGVAGYEVRSNEVYYGFTRDLSFDLLGIPASEECLIEVRAKDRNSNYSEWAGLTRFPLPNLTNPKIIYVPLEMNPNFFRAVITWDFISKPQSAGISPFLRIVTDSVPLPLIPVDYTVAPTYTDFAMAGDKFRIKASVFLYDTGEYSDLVTLDLDVDLDIPLPVTNFKVVSQTSTEMVLSWDKSASADVVSYAVSANDNSPILVPGSENTLKLSKIDIDVGEYQIEIWSIDDHGNPSIVESIGTAPEKPVKPEPPRKLVVSSGGPSSAQFAWLPPEDQVVDYVYYLSGQPEQQIFEANVTLNGLSSNTTYTFNVLAVNWAGMRSEPVTATFTTGAGLTQPWNFHVTMNEKRSVSFAWEPPKDGSENVIGYSFKVFPSGSSVALNGLSHTIHNLYVGLPVIVGVRCRFVGGGESSWNTITVIPKA